MEVRVRQIDVEFAKHLSDGLDQRQRERRIMGVMKHMKRFYDRLDEYLSLLVELSKVEVGFHVDVIVFNSQNNWTAVLDGHPSRLLFNQARGN